MATMQRTQFFRNTQIQKGVENYNVWNWLDSGLYNRIRYISKYTVYDYQGEHLENLAFKFYGDISYNWVLQMYNGINSSTTIPDGFPLKVPDAGQLNNVLSSMKRRKAQEILLENSRKGELIRI